MKIRIVSSPMLGLGKPSEYWDKFAESIKTSPSHAYRMSKEDAIKFAGYSGSVCYMKDDIDAIFNQSDEKTLRIANITLNSGHHSVYGHMKYTFAIEGIPKIVAMVLNSIQNCNVSEKSGRYTRMETHSAEKAVYDKWLEILKILIKMKYRNFDDKRVLKLAQENARYFISVFTPATSMLYTTDIREWNYIIYWMNEYIKNEEDNPFSIKVKEAFEEFIKASPDLIVDGLVPREEDLGFFIFAKEERKEEFGVNYSMNYKASFAQLAQAHRHRKLSYEFMLPTIPEFYVPKIIRDTIYEEEWLGDMAFLQENYPQGMLLNVNERGTIDAFILKCTDRLCGQAQLEIMEQTKENLKRYMDAVKDKKELYDFLLPYSHGPRCTFPHFKCTSPCIFGGKDAFNRFV